MWESSGIRAKSWEICWRCTQCARNSQDNIARSLKMLRIPRRCGNYPQENLAWSLRMLQTPKKLGDRPGNSQENSCRIPQNATNSKEMCESSIGNLAWSLRMLQTPRKFGDHAAHMPSSITGIRAKSWEICWRCTRCARNSQENVAGSLKTPQNPRRCGNYPQENLAWFLRMLQIPRKFGDQSTCSPMSPEGSTNVFTICQQNTPLFLRLSAGQ